jgi:hypothetical protein
MDSLPVPHENGDGFYQGVPISSEVGDLATKAVEFLIG